MGNTIYLDASKGSKATVKVPPIQIGFFFDGTGNNAFAPAEESSNVAKLWHAYKEDKPAKPKPSWNPDTPPQPPRIRKFYVRGVGTEKLTPEDELHDGDPVFSGSAWGAYGHERISHALAYINAVAEEYLSIGKGSGSLPPIILDVFGFSRGAALARHFVNVVTKHWPNCKSIDNTLSSEVQNKIQIRFLGLFDSVGSFGKYTELAGNNIDKGYEFRIATEQVQYCYHLTAMDEMREMFDLQTLKPLDKTSKALKHSDIVAKNAETLEKSTRWIIEEECEGVHSDIGGGYSSMWQKLKGNVDTGKMIHIGNVELSKIHLHSMYQKAVKCKVPFHPTSYFCNIKVYSAGVYENVKADFTLKDDDDGLGDVEKGKGRGKLYAKPANLSLLTVSSATAKIAHDKMLSIRKTFEANLKNGFEHYKLWKMLHIHKEFLEVVQDNPDNIDITVETLRHVMPFHDWILGDWKERWNDILKVFLKDRWVPYREFLKIHLIKNMKLGKAESDLIDFRNNYVHRSHYPFSDAPKAGLQEQKTSDSSILSKCLASLTDSQAKAFRASKCSYWERHHFPGGNDSNAIKNIIEKQTLNMNLLVSYKGNGSTRTVPSGVLVSLCYKELSQSFTYPPSPFPLEVEKTLFSFRIREPGVIRYLIWKKHITLKDVYLVVQPDGVSFPKLSSKGWSSKGKRCVVHSDGSLGKEIESDQQMQGNHKRWGRHNRLIQVVME